MGRPRKPLGVLKLAGTYRPDRHAAREHAPQPGGYPKMPDWLDGEARALWESTVPTLIDMGIARGVDAPALAGLCRWYSVWRQADARLQRGDGDSYKGSIEAAAAWKNYSAVAAKFGLTPVDREKISVTETTEPENDILDELLA